MQFTRCSIRPPQTKFLATPWVDSSRNRLASTAYFAIVSSVFCMHACIKIKYNNFVFFKSGQICMKDAEIAESADSKDILQHFDTFLSKKMTITRKIKIIKI